MNELQKEQIKKVVYTFATLSNMNDKQLCDNLINRLNNMNIDDVMDYLIVSLDDLVSSGVLKPEDVLKNANLWIAINPERYKCNVDLMTRLNWLIA